VGWVVNELDIRLLGYVIVESGGGEWPICIRNDKGFLSF